MISANRKFVFFPRAYRNFLTTFIDNAHDASPRGVETREIINATITLTNPIDRVIVDPGRKMNLAFAIAEWISIMSGIDSIDFFTQFISNYDRFSSNGETLDGAYGPRINYIAKIGDDMKIRSQIDGVINILKEDPSSRRAVMSIYQPEDLFGWGGTNTPCTLSMQFLIRNNKLYGIVNMRSSDVVLGLTYDVFVFTMIQEFVARQLGVELGEYIHNAGSMHFYCSNMPLLDQLKMRRWTLYVDPMPYVSQADIARITDLMVYKLNSDNFFNECLKLPRTEATFYLVDLAMCMKAYVERKRSRMMCKAAYQSINNQTLRHMMKPWVT